MKVKTYIATSVLLNKVENRFRGNNGNYQFTIVVRATSQKRVCELIGGNCSLSHLRNFCGIREISHEPFVSIPKKDDVIYYHVEHCRSGYVDRWLEYWPNQKC